MIDGADIRRVSSYRMTDFVPRGCTALYDAMGTSMDGLAIKRASRPESGRPENVIVAVMTDGFENAGKIYSFERVQRLIEHQRAVSNWEVLFLASELRAFEISRQMGVKESASLQWSNDTAGTHPSSK